LCGDKVRGAAVNHAGNDLSKAPYFVLREGGPDPSPELNLLLAGLFVVISRMVQMGLMIPGNGQGCSLDDIFEHKLSKLNEEESHKYLIGAELFAFVKCYPTFFKDCNAELRGPTRAKFYKEWRGTIHSAEKKMCRKLKAQLAIWYAKHPLSKKQTR
jgi:hypothetical protein